LRLNFIKIFLCCCLCFHFSVAQNCIDGQSFTISQDPPYEPGDVVVVSYTLDNFIQINENWIIAVEIFAGNGWDGLTPLQFPQNIDGQAGNWIWDNQQTFASGLNFGPGWRFVPTFGNPNYGIDSNGPFTMSFELTVAETCTADDLFISIQVFGDCQTGGWNGGGCCNDAPLTVYNGNVNVVSTAPFAGNSANVTICPSENAINLFDELGGTPDINGTWSPTLSGGYFGNYDPTSDSEGLYTYSVTNECGTSDATINLSLFPETVNPSVDVDICSNALNLSLYSELGINNTSGQWSGPVPLFNGSSPSFVGLFNPQEQISGVYNYTLIDGNGCEIIYPVDVTIISSNFDVGTSAAIQICEDDNSLPLFNELGGSPTQDGIWNPTLPNGFLGTFNSNTNPEGVYSYTVSDECSTATSNVDVSFYNVVNPPAVNFEICSDAVIDDLYGLLSINNTSGQWSGPVPLFDSPAPDYFGLFNPQQQISGLYNYTVTNSDGCDQVYSVDVSVINSQANAGNDGFVEVCEDDSPLNLFDYLLGNPDQNGVWNPLLGDGYLGLLDPSSNFSGVYSYTTTDNCGSDESEVEVSIINLTPPVITPD
jgi:hypothetical protein